ncbi:MAG: hypothetical protein DMF59_17825 [Acidobacteria bacterium]|nr:MAG: hypothetical protein DMF59_17825 [Acidobacteriota bacterium]
MFSTSNDGTLILETGAANDVSQLVWVDASGKKIEELGKPAEYRALRPSHDGRRVALAILDPATDHTDLWIMDIARRTATRLTFDPGDENAPRWSPDDSQIVYFSNAKTAGDLLVKRTSGTGTEEVIYSNNFFKIPTDWSPDGKTIFFQQQIPGKSGWDLWTFSLVDRKAQVFLQTPFDEGNALWSPDGRWVLYHSNESGKQEIYVVPADGKGGKWQISTDGGTRPRWSSDGKEIYYIVPRELKLMAVGVATQGNEFIAGTPRPLFSLENTPRNNATPYEVANDGKRFLVNTVPEQREIAPLTLIQNWTSALKK